MIPEDLVLLDRSPAITIRKRAVSGESADTLMASSSTLYVKHDIFRNAYEGNSRIVLAMLDKEPRLIDEIGELNNQTCYAPSTVLHFACRGGHISLAYELVRRGANISAKNHVGDTPLTYIEQKYQDRLIQLYAAAQR